MICFYFSHWWNFIFTFYFFSCSLILTFIELYFLFMPAHLKVTFHVQLRQNIGLYSLDVQAILEPVLHPTVCTSHCYSCIDVLFLASSGCLVSQTLSLPGETERYFLSLTVIGVDLPDHCKLSHVGSLCFVCFRAPDDAQDWGLSLD